ncbi:hypothetical protein OCS_04680 [Ophiocordyceps sinensis CO18]|uniref:Uncharacterized protein n=1 Tax=Ophiocordyceps sinensis (strain Co18 / CGMCC 3.14243) TaxID=911162 RepID=T5ACN7_OPHSC|nr:hypothetical protein OCS_04680 [Ophiocordyceps sinensis CO18]
MSQPYGQPQGGYYPQGGAGYPPPDHGYPPPGQGYPPPQQVRRALWSCPLRCSTP